MVRLQIVEHKHFISEEEMRKQYPGAGYDGQNYFGDNCFRIDIHDQEEEKKVYQYEKEHNPNPWVEDELKFA